MPARRGEVLVTPLRADRHQPTLGIRAARQRLHEDLCAHGRPVQLGFGKSSNPADHPLEGGEGLRRRAGVVELVFRIHSGGRLATAPGSRCGCAPAARLWARNRPWARTIPRPGSQVERCKPAQWGRLHPVSPSAAPAVTSASYPIFRCRPGNVDIWAIAPIRTGRRSRQVIAGPLLSSLSPARNPACLMSRLSK